MRTQFNLRNEQIHSLLDNQLNGRPHMIHITRKKAMIEIRVFKEGAKTRHISFKEIKNKSITGDHEMIRMERIPRLKHKQVVNNF